MSRTDDRNIKKQNENWANRQKKPKAQILRERFHPWSDTNRFVKEKQEKIWSSIITPENEAVIKSRDGY